MDEDELHSAVPRLDPHHQRALVQAESWVGGNIRGVGIGAMPDNSACVVVFVGDPRDARLQDLPDSCAGLPVRIEEVGDLRAEAD